MDSFLSFFLSLFSCCAVIACRLSTIARCNSFRPRGEGFFLSASSLGFGGDPSLPLSAPLFSGLLGLRSVLEGCQIL
jgi:hypothetical protein